MENSHPHLSEIFAIAENKKEPCYVYVTGQIRSTCRMLNSIPYEPKSVHFATMANMNPDFLRIIRGEGIKVFVNSLPHLATVTEHGFVCEDVIFTASALDATAMTEIRQKGVTVNLDSVTQVGLWKKLFPGAPFGIRCNIGNAVKPYGSRAGYFIGKSSRLGLVKEEIESLAGDESVEGLHLYAGTDIVDIGYLIKCYKVIVELSRLFPNIRHLDFGGGFGISEGEHEREFDMADYGARVTKLMENVSIERGKRIKLILEPGRIIGARAGYFACRVTDVKRRGKKRLVGVNASSAQFPRPLFYPDSAFHPVFVRSASGNGKGKAIPSSVYGCSTYSRDFLARDVKIPELEPGDLVLFGNAGSYCASSYTSFLGFPKPEEIFL